MAAAAEAAPAPAAEAPAAAGSPSAASAAPLKPGAKTDSPTSVYDFVATELGTGKLVDLAEYRGRVLLIVNTASKCGFTWQYGPLEELYQKYKDRGFTIIGFPCNQFGKQEPGDDRTIKEFISDTFGVTFPMMSKVAVNGAEQDPLFAFLQREQPGMLGGLFGSGFSWNFVKVLVDREGKPAARFSSLQEPMGMSSAVEKLL
ncbi:hypothetical protein FNF29_06604 [Cafeteria roenbergensis]|uniref:Glutathione peroxidase n=1 Tax=Cafeteria roenbergensis TaxID=33653 RepID=A0A5A8C688_CAFRO|nr:hypothetical protein FNF29_06604 [Cafeteria roenbergensis]|eukprot:KAA0148546.1 hypothetical protein FNF29_06604 [Cafeteria roenbergensis]